MFLNESGTSDIEDSEYSNFPQYFPQLRASNRIMYTLCWGNHIITFTNIAVDMHNRQPYMGGGQSFEMTNMGLQGAYPAMPKMM